MKFTVRSLLVTFALLIPASAFAQQAPPRGHGGMRMPPGGHGGMRMPPGGHGGMNMPPGGQGDAGMPSGSHDDHHPGGEHPMPAPAPSH
jgi:hypothetical protein